MSSSPYSLQGIAILHSRGLCSCILHPIFSSKKMHLPYCLSLRKILGRSLHVWNFSISSKNFFLSSSSVSFKCFASFGISSSENVPLPNLHPFVQALHLHGCVSSKISLKGVFLVMIFIHNIILNCLYLLFFP